MDRRKTLILFALSISLLNLSFVGVSAVPVSPYINVNPENVKDTTLTVGTTFQISIYTDYSGSDIWGWQFELTFNPTILEGVSVSNGDLITTAKHSSARFSTKGFNNTEGTLKLTLAYFYYVSPQTPYTTSGPGTLAYVTFRVKGYGASNITIVDTLTREVKLKGYDSVLGHYDIIDGFIMPENIGHGYFSNLADVNGDKKADILDLYAVGKAYGSMSGQPNWNPQCDFDKNGKIDASDLSYLNINYGKTG